MFLSCPPRPPPPPMGGHLSRSYANVARARSASSRTSRSLSRSLSRRRNDRTFTILVRTPGQVTFDLSVDKLTSLVPFDSLSWKIRKIRKIREGLAIDLDSLIDRDSLFNVLLDNFDVAATFTISRPKLRPAISKCGRLTTFDKDSFLCSIYAKNPVIPKDSLSFEFSYIMRSQHNVVVSVDPIHFKSILQLRHIYIGWQRVMIKEHVSVMQCSRCGRLGHTRGRCSHPSTTCRTCADDTVAEGHAHNFVKMRINCKEANSQFKLSLSIEHRNNDSNMSPFG